MDRLQRETLRMAIIAGEGEAVLTPPEAAALMNVSEAWLRSSDVPRADVAGPKYMKSECLKYVAVRLSHRILSA